MVEPITSLLVREMTILAKNFGHLGRTSYEISRLLRESQLEGFPSSESCAKEGDQQGKVGGSDQLTLTDPFPTPMGGDNDFD